MLSLALLLATAANDYRALGTEPFWSLRIGGGRMRLEQVGWGTISLPAPPPGRAWGGHRYAAHGMIVLIARRTCSDGMSDRRFPDTVTVVTRQRTLYGCGGTPIDPA